MTAPTMLLILDGFGHSETLEGNGVAQANKPNFDRLWQQYCHGYLSASGLRVGLPQGQIGNSEVGHMNMGAGRVVYQDLTRITKGIEEGDFFENQVLLATMNYVKKEKKSLHLMGLLSDGGVHSHIDHVIALLEMAQRQGVEKVYLHAFLDGRDVLPTSALEFLDHMQSEMTKRNTGKIATIIGRYYAMDRDKRWERLEVAYRALVFREGVLSSDYHDAMKQSYDNGITDEFVKPIIMEDGAGVSSGDAVIFF